MSNTDMRLQLPSPLSLAVAVLGYFSTAALCLKLFGTNTPLWYANAIAVVVLLKTVPATWPWLLGALWVTNVVAVHTFGDGGPALLVALCDLAEIAAAAFLIRRSVGPDVPMFSGPHALRLLAICVAVPVFSSAAGAALMWWYVGAPFMAGWRTWYGASALGLLIVTPFLLSWCEPALRKMPVRMAPARGYVALTLAALLVVVLVGQDFSRPLLFLSFPLVLLMTWTFGLPGASAGMLAATAASLWMTLNGHGALAGLLPSIAGVEHRVEAAQLFLAAVLFSSLPLAILMAQQNALAAELRRVGEARTEFLAAMSHEIRTPMTAVLGLVDLLGAEELAPKHKTYVEAMRVSGRHLLHVINDILDFSRIETGKLDLERIDFSLPDLLERVRSLVHPLAVDRGLELQIELEPHSPLTLRGDPTRLKQVMLNLLTNAVKFTERGNVSLRVSQVADSGAGARFRFEVRDTGPGIEAVHLERLFAPFTQADRSTARKYGGSGLGLAISKRLVEAMGGEIGACSSPGLGSLFYFEVPLALGDPMNLIKPGVSARAAVRPQRILIAEDVEINRSLLQSALTRRGHQLVFAMDGAQALELVQRQPFDLVLMDVQMPVMDGVEATRRIRKLFGAVQSIPIVGLTANVMAHERERYLEAGMNACVMKPIDWPQLESAIAEHGAQVPTAMATATVAAAPQGDVPPLLNARALDGLVETVGAEKSAQMLQEGLLAYARYCGRMQEPGISAADLRIEAHKVKGSAGTLGLVAVGAAAQQVEAALDAGHDSGPCVEELARTLSATRQALEAGGRVVTSGAVS